MVFVLDKQKKPLMPCSEKRARQLLTKGRAVVHQMAPFTIRLKDRLVKDSRLQELRLKLDPGSKTTGIAVLNEGKVIFAANLLHRQGISLRLKKRHDIRRSRRFRKTRYRKCRPNKNVNKHGWLPPSLTARIGQTMNAVTKLMNLLPITALSTEHVKFDTQLMVNPEISGIEYQQGELMGYEVREYLLEKWGRKCAYCGAEGVKLQVEHIIPKSRGGSNRITNLTLACEPCNLKKNDLTAAEFGFPDIQAQAKAPLKDAAAMNATRWALYERLKETGLPVEIGTGGRTKFNRITRRLPKEHWIDAACVGASTPERLVFQSAYIYLWTTTGRGSRMMCNVDKYGFPKGHRAPKKNHFGFMTGDLVKANVPQGKYVGTWRGWVAVRASGYFDIKDGHNKRLIQGVSHKHFAIVQRSCGWQYSKERMALASP